MPTKIEWTDESWNPVTGCAKVSEGCERCYAERMTSRFWRTWGTAPPPHHFDVMLHPDRLDQPLHWKKPRRIFVCSMSDMFHPDVPDKFIDRIMATIVLCPQHTFQILTKRPERMKKYFTGLTSLDRMEDIARWTRTSNLYSAQVGVESEALELDAMFPFQNVHLGVTVENQDYLWRVVELLSTPAEVRFVSAEPLLGPIKLNYIDIGNNRGWNILTGYTGAFGLRIGQPGRKLDQVIVGAETGSGARPMDLDWARDIRDQCRDANVAFFYKHGSDKLETLDGQTYHEYPEASNDD